MPWAFTVTNSQIAYNPMSNLVLQAVQELSGCLTNWITFTAEALVSNVKKWKCWTSNSLCGCAILTIGWCKIPCALVRTHIYGELTGGCKLQGIGQGHTVTWHTRKSRSPSRACMWTGTFESSCRYNADHPFSVGKTGTWLFICFICIWTARQ